MACATIDGVLQDILEAGRYKVPRRLPIFGRAPVEEVSLVDVRERDLTIKGQEILTADKVALRVSIIVRFRVTDPRAAMHEVQNFESRLYGDAQLAARRSLASMTLEAILTNRNQLSEDILHEVKDSACGYGVDMIRADVKDLVFPGNIQEIMNRVLAAERMSQVQLVEARARADVQKIEAQSQAAVQQVEAEARGEAHRKEAEMRAAATRLAATAEAEVHRIKADAEMQALRTREQGAHAYREHPALLRQEELKVLHDLASNANARIYIGFDKHAHPDVEERNGD